MSLYETLSLVVSALDSADVPHMIAGSVASALHGEPRSTQDIDIVIDPPSLAALDRALALLPDERFYVGDHRGAYERRDQFNLLDDATGWKVDLVIRHDRDFSITEFARRQPATVEGIAVNVVSPEDLVLSKLEWARLRGSERQLLDARGVVALAGSDLDHEYLRHWAERLQVSDLLDDVLRG